MCIRDRFKMDFSAIASLNFVVVVFAFLFVDIFDTLGTLIGCATKANMPVSYTHLFLTGRAAERTIGKKK